jgi:hypothetical protein
MSDNERITGVGAVNQRGEVMLIVLPLEDRPDTFSISGGCVTLSGGGKILSVETYSDRIASQARKRDSISICEMTATGKPTRASEVTLARA